MRNSTKGIAAEIAKGAFRPHTALDKSTGQIGKIDFAK